MDDLDWLTDYVDPRVAAAAVALMEWVKGQVPESWTKGNRVRWLALFVVALCYVGVWAAEISEDIRRIGVRVAAIVATYVLSKIGYEAAKKTGMTGDREAEVTVQAGEQATVSVEATESPTTHAPPLQDTQHEPFVQPRYGVPDVRERYGP